MCQHRLGVVQREVLQKLLGAYAGPFREHPLKVERTHAGVGGNLLHPASPHSGHTPPRFGPANLERAIAPFGIALDDDLVVEDDQELAFPTTAGSRFVATPRTHAITQAIVKTESHAQANTAPPRVVLQFARSATSSGARTRGQ